MNILNINRFCDESVKAIGGNQEYQDSQELEAEDKATK